MGNVISDPVPSMWMADMINLIFKFHLTAWWQVWPSSLIILVVDCLHTQEPSVSSFTQKSVMLTPNHLFRDCFPKSGVETLQTSNDGETIIFNTLSVLVTTVVAQQRFLDQSCAGMTKQAKDPSEWNFPRYLSVPLSLLSEWTCFLQSMGFLL